MQELITKVLNWAQERGIFEKATPQSQYLKTVEEVGELAKAIGKNDLHGIRDGIGDVTVTLINLSEMYGMSLKECLGAAYEEISNRTGKMVNGIFVKDE